MINEYFNFPIEKVKVKIACGLDEKGEHYFHATMSTKEIDDFVEEKKKQLRDIENGTN